MTHYRDRTVTKEFRAAVLGLYPALNKNKAFCRLLGHLLFGTVRDVDTKLLMIAAPALASMEDQEPGTNYSGQKFLDAFRAQVFDFPVQEHFWSPVPDQCRCRAVGAFTLPPALEALVKQERRAQKAGIAKENRVWLSTGINWLPRHDTAAKKENITMADAGSQQEFVNPNTRLLLAYLNHLPTNRFSSMLSHIPEAMEAAEGLADAENQMNILSGIRDNVQPLYGPAAKTTRVYSANESVLRLHRSLRKIMTQDWITADLKSAQLAIIAKVWDVPVLTQFLEQRRSIWNELLDHMGLERNEDNKAVIKRVLYAIVFGAETRRQRSILREHPEMLAQFKSGKAAHDHFLTFPLIPAILRARERQFGLIASNQGAFDAFEQFIPLVNKSGNYDNRRSVLACVAQSFELKLLMPVITLAVEQQMEKGGFTITTFLHDGFTFEAHRHSDTERWKTRLFDAVDARAQELGILTHLEFE